MFARTIIIWQRFAVSGHTAYAYIDEGDTQMCDRDDLHLILSAVRRNVGDLFESMEISNGDEFCVS